MAQGLAPEDSVRAATTGDITLSGAPTSDGVFVIAGDRVFAKNQSTASENGVDVAAAAAWSRATDADSEGDLRGASVFIEEGTANADTLWVMTTNAPITVGSGMVVGGDQVVGARAGAIADPAGGMVIGLMCRAAVVQILNALRSHGLIAP